MARSSLVYRPGHPKASRFGMVNVGDLTPDEGPQVDEHVHVVTDLYMDGHSSQDGVDIGSRVKRREYMKANNVVDASDCSKKFFQEKKDRAEREIYKKTHETVGRLFYTDPRWKP
jgi:hypothetical protein